jgi:FKBP-type peptidyl-prolyl cis-trans isomerase FkpA
LALAAALLASGWASAHGNHQHAATPPAPAASKGAVTRSAPEMGFTLVSPGQGATPTLADTVHAHYRGTLPDGTEFDSSYKRGQPASFPLGRVIKCWQQGLQRMQVGAKAKLVCPPELAYGSRGAGQVIPPNATLHFEVELLGITPPAPAPAPQIEPKPSAPASAPR